MIQLDTWLTYYFSKYMPVAEVVVGVSDNAATAVLVAQDHCKELLNTKLKKRGLKQLLKEHSVTLSTESVGYRIVKIERNKLLI